MTGATKERRIVVGYDGSAVSQAAARGLGGLRAALGSVSHALLHDADRPLVVVPHTLTPEEQEELTRIRGVTPVTPPPAAPLVE